MALSNLYSRMQQALILTSLLANTSDFAAVDKSSMPSATGISLDNHVVFSLLEDNGASIIPNIDDPQAIDAQTVCPGYIATDIDLTQFGLTAHLGLAGEPCNIYGTDVHDLDLVVEYQTESRLRISIKPSYVTAANSSWYGLPSEWVPQPHHEKGTAENAGLRFDWTNSPTFGFNVTRKVTGEVLFCTDGSKLVYEDQFIEFASSMNENYNVYGLGEVFHGLRLEPGLTRTIYSADVADPIDRNLYGNHPFYLETRYYETDLRTGNQRPIQQSTANTSANHESTSHGAFLRNAHGLEILMRNTNMTWRALGGEIDLYFFSGSSQPEVTRQYQAAIGLPAMQQYWTLGYHQCKWVSRSLVLAMNYGDVDIC